MQNFRLESGKKVWQALWEFRHPDAECFTSAVSRCLLKVLLARIKCGKWGLTIIHTVKKKTVKNKCDD